MKRIRTEWVFIFLAIFAVTAGYLTSAPVTLPLTPTAGGLIKAADMLANFNAVIAGVNSINDAQVAAAAAIQGSKLAINSIPYSALASSAITSLIATATFSIVASFPATLAAEESVAFSAGALTATFTATFTRAILSLNGITQRDVTDYTHTAGSNICTFPSALPFSGVCTVWKF